MNTGSENVKSRGRPAAHPGESAHTQILESALEEFGRHGFEGGSVVNIAKRAGVAKQLVYYHFESKDKLWYAVVTHAMSALHAEIAKLPFELHGMDPVEMVKLVVRKYAYFCAHHPWVSRMILSETARDTERALWVQTQYQEPAYEMFEGLQVWLNASGRFKPISVAHLLPMINGAINALTADSAILLKRYNMDTNDPKIFERHAEVVVDALLHGLLAKG
jgi:TetR/AcrR family transcriptional regulator